MDAQTHAERRETREDPSRAETAIVVWTGQRGAGRVSERTGRGQGDDGVTIHP